MFQEGFVSVIGNLSERDRFTVMSFASEVTVLTKEMKQEGFQMNSLNCLLTATDYNKLNAVNFINNLEAQGGWLTSTFTFTSVLVRAFKMSKSGRLLQCHSVKQFCSGIKRIA